jgi:hypothetical protein
VRNLSAPEILSEQVQHQVRLVRERMPGWIPWIFVIGLCVSALILFTSIHEFLDGSSPTFRLAVFALFSLFFGWVVVGWLLPFRPRPRIVPYFGRELGPYGGKTMTAFARGLGLYLEIGALDELARALRVQPLSSFGFAYDHFQQQVRWHPASEGLATVEALRQSHGTQAHDVAEDLEVLASVLRTAVEKDIPFSLVLRLHEKDNMQMVCTREVRQGSFW